MKELLRLRSVNDVQMVMICGKVFYTLFVKDSM